MFSLCSGVDDSHWRLHPGFVFQVVLMAANHDLLVLESMVSFNPNGLQ